tara:strand:+ start:5635 stop:6885 length:1251 start_codon:yes stop_codon:yes gene_type:complete
MMLIDLFAGCGGLSLGLEKAGFKPVYVNELNPDALETYLMNREEFPYLRDHKFHSNDIKECINEKRFFSKLKSNLKKQHGTSEVDLICGGPPCQGFSGIGHRKSYSVEKKKLPSNYLYKDMAFFIEKLKPKIFLFENVQGLLFSKWTKEGKKGEIWEDVLNTFKSIKGYNVKFKLVKAKEYGVPQNRPRIILVGIRKDIIEHVTSEDDAVESGFLPEGDYDYPDLEEALSDLDEKKYPLGGKTEKYLKDPKTIWQRNIRKDKKNKTLLKGAVLTEQEYSKHSKSTVERLSAIMDNNGVVPEKYENKKFSIKWLPKKWGNLGPNMTITSSPDDFIHYSKPRIPTVRECARLQTFPDYYKFSGKRTTGGIRRAGNPRVGNFHRELPKYTQIGNAVPVKMAEEFGKHFKKILRKRIDDI